MASKETETKHLVAAHVFDCDSTEIPPGTKSRARLLRDLESDAFRRRVWWLVSGVAVAALLTGVIIGRFLLSG